MDDSTFSGLLLLALLVASVLSYPVSRFLLHLYHRSFTGTIQRGGSAPRAVAGAREPPRRPQDSLPIRDAASAPQSPLHADLWNAPLVVAAVYAVAGTCHALVMAVGTLLADGTSLSVPGLAVMSWAGFWPAVLTALLVAGARIGHRRALAAYFGSFVALAFIVAGPRSPWYSFLLYWVLMNGPATVLLAAYLSRGIRAVGPMVLAFMLLMLVGAQLPLALLEGRFPAQRAAIEAGSAFGMGAIGIVTVTASFGLVIVAVAGWALLKWLGRSYEHKRFSDQSLTIAALWLLFGMLQSLPLAQHGWGWFLTGFVAFGAFCLARAAAFHLLRSHLPPRPRTLLLLRVFSLGARSERLFDVLRMHWLRRGAITMIAGPDLVTSTVEPHEFLDFLGGKLSRQFVQDRADLDRRLQRMDAGIDPDGRYRVNEFFCLPDTWQMVMRELAGSSDAVLMDLRSFSPANNGCLYELGELLKAVDLHRVVLVIDASTDRKFLQESLDSLWQATPAHSPNRRDGACARTFELPSPPSAQSMRELLAVLA